MSKVISFSISDKYLDKLRTLYPSFTDNLAAKQFITDGLDGSLGNSLDGSLDDGLDDRVKSLIESWVDGLLDERLDASVGKLITSLSERMARLEARLDDSLDGRLDDMERLLRLQQSASIASPIPTGEPSPHGEPAIETVTPEVSPSPPGTDVIASIDGSDETGSDTEPVKEAIEDSKKKIPLPDILIGSQIETVESVCEDKPDAIGTVGMTAMAAVDYLKAKKVKVSYDSLNRWINKEETIPDTRLGKKVQEYLTLINQLYYPNP